MSQFPKIRSLIYIRTCNGPSGNSLNSKTRTKSKTTSLMLISNAAEKSHGLKMLLLSIKLGTLFHMPKLAKYFLTRKLISSRFLKIIKIINTKLLL